jgi:hypothetical protein
MRRKKFEKLTQSLSSWEAGLARLGECIVQFQRIEDVLGMCIAAMIGRNRKVGEIVTADMSFRTKVSVYGALFLHNLEKESLPDDIVELIQRIQWAEQQRNTLVHSLWDASESKPECIKREKKAIRKRIFSVAEEHLTPAELDELNRTLEGIVTDLLYLTSLYLPKVEKRLT